jgi:MoxR-like ATPase
MPLGAAALAGPAFGIDREALARDLRFDGPSPNSMDAVADRDFLLEFLSDFQISIPEIGTIKAQRPPIVIVTSNRTREVHDALKRRCLYHWIDYPSFDKELEIVQAKVPEASGKMARQVTAFVQELRGVDLYKVPGVAETLDWVSALVALDQQALHQQVVEDTLGVILKYRDDLEMVRGDKVGEILDQVDLLE